MVLVSSFSWVSLLFLFCVFLLLFVVLLSSFSVICPILLLFCVFLLILFVVLLSSFFVVWPILFLFFVVCALVSSFFGALGRGWMEGTGEKIGRDEGGPPRIVPVDFVVERGVREEGEGVEGGGEEGKEEEEEERGGVPIQLLVRYTQEKRGER